MELDKNNTKIRDHYMLMDVIGEYDFEPSKKDIIDYLRTKGWEAKKIKINYDNFTKKWHMECKIS